MPRPLTPAITGALDNFTTAPLVLVSLGFDTPVYLSSRDNISWDSKTWVAAGLTVKFSGDVPIVSVFNEGTTLGRTVLADGTAGRSITTYLAYPDTGGNYSDPQIQFKGIMGRAEVGEFVVIATKESLPIKTPRQYVVPPTFNSMPKDNERIVTPEGIIVLEM